QYLPQDPRDGVRVHVRRVHCHGGGEIEHDLPVGGGLDHVHDRFADLHRELHFGARVALGRVLVEDLRPGQGVLELPAELGRVDRDVDDARLVEAKHHAALEDGGGVVEVHDGAPGALQALVGPLDQLGTTLGQDLDGDIVRHEVFLDEDAYEVEVRLGGRGKAHLDLLEADGHEGLEHAPLALRVPGLA